MTVHVNMSDFVKAVPAVPTTRARHSPIFEEVSIVADKVIDPVLVPNWKHFSSAELSTASEKVLEELARRE